jgi:hypothetical protein
MPYPEVGPIILGIVLLGLALSAIERVRRLQRLLEELVARKRVLTVSRVLIASAYAGLAWLVWPGWPHFVSGNPILPIVLVITFFGVPALSLCVAKASTQVCWQTVPVIGLLYL